MTASVLIVDDHPVVRQGIRSLLSNPDRFEIVGEAQNSEEALERYRALRPDVTLLDIRLGEANGLDVLEAILLTDPAARVLMLSSFDDHEYVMRSLRAGAFGYLLKGDSDTTLVNAVDAVANGEHALSPQVTSQLLDELFAESSEQSSMDETDVSLLRMLAEGDSNSAIAQALFISDTTVKRRLRNIFGMLEVATRAEAAAEAVRRGLI